MPLQQLHLPRGAPGQDVHLVVLGRPDVRAGQAAAVQLDGDCRLERVTSVGPAGAVEERDESRVHRVGLPAVQHPLPLGVGLDPHRPHLVFGLVENSSSPLAYIRGASFQFHLAGAATAAAMWLLCLSSAVGAPSAS